MNDFLPLKIDGQCIVEDEILFANMDAAIARGLKQITKMLPPRDGVIALVGSGPSAAGELATISAMKAARTPIVAIKDAHDWLQENGITPDYAVAIDPQEHRWNCFRRKNDFTQYMIASQCHPSMFDHLSEQDVTIWHPYIKKGQNWPRNALLVSGGTTSGLRSISLFYVLGWRHFALFGFDSCLNGKNLRVNGDGLKPGESPIEVRLDPDGETFYCNGAMALQADQFQTYYDYLPDAQYYPYGKGLIQSIIERRMQNGLELQRIIDTPRESNHRVSFIHGGNQDVASYRYRAQIPDVWSDNSSLNELSADVLIFAKPQASELMDMARAKASGRKVIVDFCDDHFGWGYYQEALRLADAVTCPTQAMADIIKGHGREAHVIPDPYEYLKRDPHCNGAKLLWFGHFVNQVGIRSLACDLGPDADLHIVGNFDGCIPWSWDGMLREFKRADIVVLPATAPYKSSNRAVEAIRQGCFVVAEPHPALEGIPGIWIGDIKEGIEWAQQHSLEANQRTLEAQKYVETAFSPLTVTDAWRKVIQSLTTSDAEKRIGLDGSESILVKEPSLDAICVP